MTSAKIIVCSLDIMEEMVERNTASHLVSLINAQMMPQTPLSVEKNNHLKLSMNDIEIPVDGAITPSLLHIERLVEFVLEWDQSSPMVIHCWAGISRSTAAAFISLCALNPDIHETRIANLLRQKSATATPNNLLISCADQHLGSAGRMSAAIKSIGRGAVASAGLPFSIPVALDGVEQ